RSGPRRDRHGRCHRVRPRARLHGAASAGLQRQRTRHRVRLQTPAVGRHQSSRSADVSTFLEVAQKFAAFGWAVFPLAAGSKQPIPGSHGFKDASKDPLQIAVWFGIQYATGNIGVATGAVSGIVVLDVDVKPGKRGDVTLSALVEKHGPLPDTLMQATPSG